VKLSLVGLIDGKGDENLPSGLSGVASSLKRGLSGKKLSLKYLGYGRLWQLGVVSGPKMASSWGLFQQNENQVTSAFCVEAQRKDVLGIFGIWPSLLLLC